jgi:hypothetical protein
VDALDPRSQPNSYAASCLPPALLVELEDIQSIGGLAHLNGVGSKQGVVAWGTQGAGGS